MQIIKYVLMIISQINFAVFLINNNKIARNYLLVSVYKIKIINNDVQ